MPMPGHRKPAANGPQATCAKRFPFRNTMMIILLKQSYCMYCPSNNFRAQMWVAGGGSNLLFCPLASEITQEKNPQTYKEGVISQNTFSSLSHFSNSCFLPCCKTGLHSSRDSILLSLPWSNRMPKYCSNGEVWPCWDGTCWNLWMVCGVLNTP